MDIVPFTQSASPALSKTQERAAQRYLQGVEVERFQNKTAVATSTQLTAAVADQIAEINDAANRLGIFHVVGVVGLTRHVQSMMQAGDPVPQAVIKGIDQLAMDGLDRIKQYGDTAAKYALRPLK